MEEGYSQPGYEELRQEVMGRHLMAASWGNRLANYLLDMVFFYLVAFIFGIVLALLAPEMIDSLSEINSIVDRIITALLMVLYKFIFEAFFSQTIGKMITGTRVVMQDGTKPPVLNILGRSFARLIPFEAFSFLSANPVGWHDSLSNTMVVRNSELIRVQAQKPLEEEEQY